MAYHDYSKLSPVNITKLFSNVSWDHILWEDNIDSMVDKFSDLYQFLVSQVIKRKTKFVKSQTLPVWIDKEVQRAMKERDTLKSQKIWDLYRVKRNHVTNLIRRKKKLYIEHLIDISKGGNTQPIWDALNVKKSVQKTQDIDIPSHSFNTYFATAAGKLDEAIPQSQFSIPDQTTKRLSSIPNITPIDCLKSRS